MASYPPPLENLPIFNTLVFTEASTASSGVTPAPAPAPAPAPTYYSYQLPQGLVITALSKTFSFPTMKAGTYFLYVTTSVLTDQSEVIQYSFEVSSASSSKSPLYVQNYPYLNNNTTIGGYMPLSGQTIITLSETPSTPLTLTISCFNGVNSFEILTLNYGYIQIA